MYFIERRNERQQFDTSEIVSWWQVQNSFCLYNLSFHLADDDLINLQIFLADLFNSTIYRNKKDPDANESMINRKIINDMRRPFQKRSKKKVISSELYSLVFDLFLFLLILADFAHSYTFHDYKFTPRKTTKLRVSVREPDNFYRQKIFLTSDGTEVVCELTRLDSSLFTSVTAPPIVNSINYIHANILLVLRLIHYKQDTFPDWLYLNIQKNFRHAFALFCR